MDAIDDATVATMAWTAEPGSYVMWAPGDATLYRVQLVTMVASSGSPDPYGAGQVLLVRCGLGSDMRHILVPHRPYGEKWTALLWLQADLPPGWWAGIRPLLAALGWADGEPVFTRSDAIRVGTLMARSS